MSRIAKTPVSIAPGIEVKIDGQDVQVKGAKGTLAWSVNPAVMVSQEDGELRVAPHKETKQSWALAGTTRALLNNMIIGCSNGFSKKLTLIGVGYRAAMKGKELGLSLGFSHPVNYAVPEGIQIETPSQTEIVVSGADKQQVGQVAAEIRSYRPPEPYKGKGIRYADEHVLRKEAKKK
ncbi:MAG: 50S ribosomal protein L6 [Gammaproteobacteria bacterium]|nr:50S ribosomal protein L6 [Gammaproteobacteria bacterium]